MGISLQFYKSATAPRILTLYNQCLTPLKISQNKRKTKEMFKLDQTNLSKGIDVKTCGKPQEKSNSSAPGNNYVIHNNK